MRKGTILVVMLSLMLFQAKAQYLVGPKTVGPSGDYPNLTQALNAMKLNGVVSGFILELLPGYTSTTETFPLVFTQIAISGSSPDIIIRPHATATNLSIASSNSLTLDLNGISHLIIDGRSGGTGNINLTISNALKTGKTIRFISNASYNQLRFLNIKGSDTTSAGGVIYFAGTSPLGGRGNDSNIISNCTIQENNAVYPANCINASGQLTPPSGTPENPPEIYNSGNKIFNNNIFNNWSTGSETNGILIGPGNIGWEINGNSIYQSIPRYFKKAFTYNGIKLNSTSSVWGMDINGNYFGGTSSKCGGSPMSLQDTLNISYNAALPIVLNDTLRMSYYRNNVVANIRVNTDVPSGHINEFNAVTTSDGSVRVLNNLVGSDNAYGSIILRTAGVHGFSLMKIGRGTDLVRGNRFGGIDVRSTEITGGMRFTCILTSQYSRVTHIDSNIIGNALPENIVFESGPEFKLPNVNYIYGIHTITQSSIPIYVRYNMVRNIRNLSRSVLTFHTGTRGINIDHAGKEVTVAGNTVCNLIHDGSFEGEDADNTRQLWYAFAGIHCGGIGGENYANIYDNTIFNLVNNNSSSIVTVNGIVQWVAKKSRYYIERNKIFSLSSACNTSQILGINIYYRGLENEAPNYDINHNMIHLGLDSLGNPIPSSPVITGIFKNDGVAKCFHNTVYITGKGAPGNDSNNSTCILLYRTGNGLDSVANNNFINTRENTGFGGNHYAVTLMYFADFFHDYNNLYAKGDSAYVGNFLEFHRKNLSDWQSITAFDLNSGSLMPAFKSAAGPARQIDLHVDSSRYRGLHKGFPPAGWKTSPLSFDIDNEQTNVPPEAGADEVPIDAQIYSIDSPEITSFCGTSKTLYFSIRNNGLEPIRKVRITCLINGLMLRSFDWTGRLGPGEISQKIAIAPYHFKGGIYQVSVRAHNPNDILDYNPDNDSLVKTYTITPIVYPGVTAKAQATAICPGMSITFSAKTIDPGPAPTFQWFKNNNPVATASSYTDANLNDKDSIWVTMVSSAPCPIVSSTVTSPKVKMTVSNTFVPAVIISQTDSVICQGKPITFLAEAINCGITPHYQWKKNGQTIGTDTSEYVLQNPSNGDVIRCIVTSSLSCATYPRDSSQTQPLVVKSIVKPAMVVAASQTSICAGSAVSFYGTVQNGGSNPFIIWQLTNGQPIGLGNDSLIDFIGLRPGDSVYARLTSSAECADPWEVNSNKVAVNITPVTTPKVLLFTNKNPICIGDSLYFDIAFSDQGSSPVFQWYKNGNLIRTGGTEMKVGGLNHLDSFYVKMTSNAACITQPVVNSNKRVVTVLPFETPDIAIQTINTTICSGTPVNFKSTVTGGGFGPVIVWYKNSVAFETGSTFNSNLFNNKDTVFAILTSSSPCITKAVDTSNKMIMNVNPPVIPVIQISSPNNPFCQDMNVVIHAAIDSGGTFPSYQWLRNGVPVGFNLPQYSSTSLLDKDTIQAILTSSSACAVNPAASNKLIMLKAPNVSTNVHITVSAQEVCANTPVIFNSSVGNEGSNPHYQWLVHGTFAGTDSPSYKTTGLADGDTVWLEMTSSVYCAVPKVAKSNIIIMRVFPSHTPKVTVTANVDTACENSIVTFTATDIDGGTPPNHQWIKSGFVTTANGSQYSTNVRSTDIIQCVLTTDLTCPTKLRDTFTVKMPFKPAPLKPKITRGHDTLYSTFAPSYQWIGGTTELPGANGRTYVVAHNGQYRVMIDSNGCKMTSDPVTVTNFLGLENERTIAANIYPNPSSGIYTIEFAKIPDGGLIIEVYDMQGKKLLEQNLNTARSWKIDLSGSNNGMYLLKVINGEEYVIHKLIKVN